MSNHYQSTMSDSLALSVVWTTRQLNSFFFTYIFLKFVTLVFPLKVLPWKPL